MDFKAYSSIENIHRLKFINDIHEHGLSYGEWTVSEKIHGSNFSFWVTNNSIKCAKRSGFLAETEDFFNHQDILEEYYNNINILFSFVSEVYKINPDALQITLFGEICGGIYPHPEVPRNPIASRVQKGVYYSPDNEFIAFDLKVNGRFINYKIFEELMSSSDFLWAKSLFIGDFKTCCNYQNEFQTTIPDILELPRIEGNICEGVVIKPLDARFFPNHDRVILKNKNDKFKEVENKKSKQIISLDGIEVITLTDREKIFIEEANRYICDNRLKNVLSKIGVITDKDFGKVAGLLTQDVITDLKKDHEEMISVIDKQHWNMIKNAIKANCITFVRSNFINIIDGIY